MKIAIAGCGALGSMIAMHLAHPDHTFLLLDDERIEDVNILTSAYYHHHIGGLKAVVLAEMMWQKARCVCDVDTRTLTPALETILDGCDLVVDTFDNTAARALTRHVFNSEQRYAAIVHVGVTEDRIGAVTWDERYVLPEGYERGVGDFCTRHAGTRILRLTAVTAATIIEQWMDTGRKRDVLVTESLRVLE